MGGSDSKCVPEIDIKDEVPKCAGVYRIWSGIYSCVEDKKFRRTVFVKKFTASGDKQAKFFIENGLKVLRQLRHPHILNYALSEITAHEITLLTERVEMLDLVIDSLIPVEIQSGLVNILSAVIFMHEKARICHNNINPSSIFVTADGRWKLGGFECAHKFTSSKQWIQCEYAHSIRMQDYVPQEDQAAKPRYDISSIARDAFAYGKLIDFALPYLRGFLDDAVTNALSNAANHLTVDDAADRADLNHIMDSFPLAFENSFLNIIEFLQNIHSKSEIEKMDFFESVCDELKKLPSALVGKRLVPLLLSRYIILESIAHEKLLPLVLQAFSESEVEKDGLIPKCLYDKVVVPEILKIFHVHETSVRLAILTNFHLYMRHFSMSDLEKVILPELKFGLRDTDDRIVSASMHALATLVPIIGATRIFRLRRAKFFVDGAPKNYSDQKHGTNFSCLESKVVSSEKLSELQTFPSLPVVDENVCEPSETMQSHNELKVVQATEFALETEWIDENWWSGSSVTKTGSYKDLCSAVPEESDRDDFSQIQTNSKFGNAETDDIIENSKEKSLCTETTNSNDNEIEEPDFFADMAPVFNKESRSRIHFETEPWRCGNDSSVVSKRFSPLVHTCGSHIVSDMGEWNSAEGIDFDENLLNT